VGSQQFEIKDVIAISETGMAEGASAMSQKESNKGKG